MQDGDTLTTIADMWFGDGRKWPLILAANEGVDPSRLRIGQKIKMPNRNAKPGPSSPPAGPSGSRSGAAAAAGDASTYVVAEGDTLYSIARSRLGDGQRWEELYEANRATIGADPKALKVGMRLAVPAVSGRGAASR